MLSVEKEAEMITPETSSAAFDQSYLSELTKPQAETKTSTAQKDVLTDQNKSSITAVEPALNTDILGEKVEPEFSKQTEKSGEKNVRVEVITVSEKTPSEAQNQASLNPLEHSQDIATTIPSAQKEGGDPLFTHIVVAGDSLWKIAKAYRVSVSEIRSWNNLNEDAVLQIGQIIRFQSKKLGTISRPEQVSLETPETSVSPSTLPERVIEETLPIPQISTKEWIVDIAAFDAGKDFQALAAAGDLLRAGIDVQLYKTATSEIRIFGKKVSSSKEAVDQLKLIRRNIKNRSINPTVVEFGHADLGSLQSFNPSKKMSTIVDTNMDSQPTGPELIPEIIEDESQPKSTFFGFEVTPTEIDF
jgi:LysM repeat protein